MPRNLIALDSTNPIRHRLLGVAAVSIAALGCAGAASSDAHALIVTSDANGLQIREPGFTGNRVKLSLVFSGGLKYRVENPNFGGGSVGAGAGCVKEPTVGASVALCDRITPKVSEVSLGPGISTFDADPSFPDPIVVNDTNTGPDRYQLGAGNDVARGGSRDSFVGGAGNDDLATVSGKTEGGDGNDRLLALNQGDFTRGSDMIGGAGDDTLTAEGRAFVKMVGGPGTDSFEGNGAVGFIDARDGVREQVSCGKRSRNLRRLRLINTPRVFRKVMVDLADAPNDASLIKDGCTDVDRAPQGEKTAAQVVSNSLKLRRGRVGVKVKCTTSKRCRGKLSVTVKGRTRSQRYSIRGRRTATIRLATRRGNATVRIREKGRKGARTTRAALKVTR